MCSSDLFPSHDIYVLWPDEFEPAAVFYAVRFARNAQDWANAAGSMSRFLARGSDAAKRALAIAEEFRASIYHLCGLKGSAS